MCEFQNAYESSRRNVEIIDEIKRINELIAQGKYVVVKEMTVCCPHTDATIGLDRRIVSIHDTEDEAIEARGPRDPEWYDESDPYVVGPPNLKAIQEANFSDDTDDEVPF